MRWTDWFQDHPDLLPAFEQIVRSLEDLEPANGFVDGGFPQGQLASAQGAILVLLWSRTKSLLENLDAIREGGHAWSDLGQGVRNGKFIRTFMSATGELISIPEDIYRVVIEGKTIDGNMTAHPFDPRLVRVVRDKTVELSIPKSLILHLVKQRDEARSKAG